MKNPLISLQTTRDSKEGDVWQIARSAYDVSPTVLHLPDRDYGLKKKKKRIAYIISIPRSPHKKSNWKDNVAFEQFYFVLLSFRLDISLAAANCLRQLWFSSARKQ